VTDVARQTQTEQLVNPLRPGTGVASPYLAGRDPLPAAFKRFLGEAHPPCANWTLTGIRGTGKTVLLGEFATRGECSGWLCLERELGDRHRDEARLADAFVDDCAALLRRCSSLAGIGDALERAWQYVRPGLDRRSWGPVHHELRATGLRAQTWPISWSGHVVPLEAVVADPRSRRSPTSVGSLTWTRLLGTGGAEETDEPLR
jgi:hypothetical protein